MTQTTTAPARIYTVPNTGLRHEAADGTVIEVNPTYGSGYNLRVLCDGNVVEARNFANDTPAINVYQRLVAEHPAEVVDAAPAVKLAPAAKGTQTHMSPAEIDLILETLAGGTNLIHRGRGAGRADIKQLQALARRPFAQLVGPQFRPTGAVITSCGALTAIDLDNKRRAAAERAARIARVLATTAA